MLSLVLAGCCCAGGLLYIVYACGGPCDLSLSACMLHAVSCACRILLCSCGLLDIVNAHGNLCGLSLSECLLHGLSCLLDAVVKGVYQI